jgi:hypothetical protein
MALLFRSAAVLLEAGQSVALESNFYSEWDTPPLRQLGEKFACRFVQVVCTASGPTLVERYKRRIVTRERHPGHTESEPLEETPSRLLNGRWDALDLDGPVIHVDTERQAPGHPVDAIIEERGDSSGTSANPAHHMKRTGGHQTVLRHGPVHAI